MNGSVTSIFARQVGLQQHTHLCAHAQDMAACVATVLDIHSQVSVAQRLVQREGGGALEVECGFAAVCAIAWMLEPVSSLA